MTTEQVFGWLGAFFITIILIPQIIKAFQTRQTADLSMLMLVFSALGNSFWALHALLTSNVPLIACATLVTLMSLVLIVFKYTNEKQ